MAAWVCAECTTTFSVGAPRCPHCGSTTYQEEGVMPKITRHGGPSIAGVTAAWGDEPDTVEQEGGEEPSLGSSSSTSDEKPPTTPETSGSGPRRRARTTGSRSKPARTEGSSARSTAGESEADASATDDSADGGESA